MTFTANFEHDKTLAIISRVGPAPLSLISEIFWSFPSPDGEEIIEDEVVLAWQEDTEEILTELRDAGLVEACEVERRTPLGRKYIDDGWKLTTNGEAVAKTLPASTVSHLTFPKAA